MAHKWEEKPNISLFTNVQMFSHRLSFLDQGTQGAKHEKYAFTKMWYKPHKPVKDAKNFHTCHI